MRGWVLGLLLAATSVARALPCYQGELTADKAVELSLRYSPEVALADFQADLVRAERERTASESNLKIGLGMLAARQGTSMIYASGGDPNFLQVLPSGSSLNFNAMAMLPLYNGGWLGHRLAAAEQAERASLARQQVALQSTCRRARLAFYEVAQARAELAAAEQAETARRELLEKVEQRFRLGRVARYLVLRAEAEVATARQQLNSARSRYLQREAELKSQLGLSWESHFDYREQQETPKTPESLASSLLTARERRPDLVAARLAIQEGDQRLLASLAEFSPRLALVAQAESMGSSGMGWKPGASVGLSFSFPLYDGGQRQAQVRAAEAEVNLRQTALQQLELQLESEVTIAHAGLTEALENAALAEVELAKASEEWRIARLRFEVGRGLYLEMLDALAACARARSNRLRAIFEAHRRQADYLYATGGL
ncbi:TolC family protein [bacterium]|nr:TolC family protein [bacterium]